LLSVASVVMDASAWAGNRLGKAWPEWGSARRIGIQLESGDRVPRWLAV